MENALPKTVNSIQSDIRDQFHEMSLHAQELDLNTLEHLHNNHNNPKTNLTASSLKNSCQHLDLDDILPSESFSAQVSPTTSLVDGAVPEKTPIDIFQQPQPSYLTIPAAHPESICFTSSIEVPSLSQSIDRKRDDIPTRCSDVEDSPPLEAARLVADEIPSIDPLDSDDEWQSISAYASLPTKDALNQLPTNVQVDGGEQMGIIEEKKRKKKKRKKSKAVLSSLPLWLTVR